MSRPTVDFLIYLLGRRGPRTSVTAAERDLLCELAREKTCVVEVGVFEGATSVSLAEAINPDGCVWLVDPFFRHTRPERFLGFSYSEFIAKATVGRCSGRVRFLRMTSVEGARNARLRNRAELVFIDGDHSYEAVHQDFLAWLPNVAPAGVVAFHDSRCSSDRPELLPSTGPVRLVDEILRGQHGSWTIVAEAGSLAAVRRTQAT